MSTVGNEVNNDKISEELFDPGPAGHDLTLPALINRYTRGTQMMRAKPTVVAESRELGLRQRERAVEFIMQLLLANNGHPSFKTPLSNAKMKAAREYILHGGDPEEEDEQKEQEEK